MTNASKTRRTLYDKLVEEGYSLYRVAFYNRSKEVAVSKTDFKEVEDMETEHVYYERASELFYIYTFAETKHIALEFALQKIVDYMEKDFRAQKHTVIELFDDKIQEVDKKKETKKFSLQVAFERNGNAMNYTDFNPCNWIILGADENYPVPYISMKSSYNCDIAVSFTKEVTENEVKDSVTLRKLAYREAAKILNDWAKNIKFKEEKDGRI